MRSGEPCDRCGQFRVWNRWRQKRLCGDDHDLVCDLCHVDAHIEAFLPVLPPLDVLIDPERHGAALARNADRTALVALYNATDGPNWEQDNNWLTNAPVGEWYGVAVNDQQRVTGLNLALNRLRVRVASRASSFRQLEHALPA